MQLQEVHALALADLYNENNKFRNLSIEQIVGIFSCFTNISIPDDKKLQYPACNDHIVRSLAKTLTNKIGRASCRERV